MKRISYFLMAFVFAAATCFTACQKDETENEEATLEDFTGTYEVNIAVKNSLTDYLLGGSSYDVTMKINAVTAATLEKNIKTSYELLDVAAKSYLDTANFDWRSEKLAEFTFTAGNSGVDDESNTWWPILTQVYGYVKDGYLYMASPDISGDKVLIFASRLGWHEDGKAGTWTGYYLDKEFLMGLIEDNANSDFDYTKFDWSKALTDDDKYSVLTFTATRK